MSHRERALFWLVLIEGIILLSALPAVVLPTDVMEHVHQAVGMGALPRAPLVEYLTRSASLLYALWGPLYLYLAFDLRRSLPLLRFLGLTKVLFGGGVMAIDLHVGMPWFWTIAEGPVIIAFGLGQFLLARKELANSAEKAAP